MACQRKCIGRLPLREVKVERMRGNDVKFRQTG